MTAAIFAELAMFALIMGAVNYFLFRKQGEATARKFALMAAGIATPLYAIFTGLVTI